MGREDPRTDAQLVEAIEDGDPRAFETLYRRHRQWAADLARRFLHDPDAALDVVQDAFLHLLGRFPGFRLTARFRTYLYPVVKHLALDRAERRRRDAPTDGLDELPAHRSNGSSPGVAVRAAVESLSPVHREAVLMRFVDDLSLDEIAAALNVPLGTVKSRLHHALAALRGDP
jgi:RNA polymerase sigma-70 factor (ECF subfamily)